MAIQHRRGANSDFDPTKMLPGEFAVTTDGTRKVYVAFGTNDVEELATNELDVSLTEEGKAADAKATGEKIEKIKTDVVNYVNQKAYSMKFVDVLPEVGENRTYYLVPNKSNTGYDKYWWITDNDGNEKWDVFGASSTLIVDSLEGLTPDESVDYILRTNGGYLYYKYIDNDWRIIAGSLAYVADTLPSIQDGSEFTDYYILNYENDVYIHYRFINGAYKVVGGNTYTKDEINRMMEELNISVGNLKKEVTNLGNELCSYYHTITQDEETENYIMTLYQVRGDEETVASQTVLPATGGGGGGGVTTNLVVEKITASPLIITTNDPAIIEINFSSADQDGEEIDGNYTWKSGSTVIMSGMLTQGRNQFDLSEFALVGTQKFTLIVTDAGGSSVLKTWTIQRVDVRIETTFSDRYAFPIGRSVSFTYTPYGAINKTIHFKLDDTEETITTSASGTLQSYTIPAQAHGAHLLEVWMTATINNSEIESNHIRKDIIWYDEMLDESGNYQEAIIGCIYRNGRITVRQYDTASIIFNVYDQTTNYPTVKRYVNDELVGTDILSENQGVWNFKSDEIGEHTLKIVCRNTEVIITVEIVELGINISPITGGLEVDFNPVGITNNSENRIWSNGTYSMSVSDNFDWANGGYRTDEKGDSYFLVKAGTSVSFDYLMFGGGLSANPSINGADIKLIFMTENVQDANAVWFSNVETTSTETDGIVMNTNVGIQMSAHNGWLKTNNASDSDVASDTETVAATNTYLYMPYSEEDIIEMDINIDTIDRDDATAKAFVMAYEDGVPSKSYVYDSGDRFYQYNPQPITIGSELCDVRIYRMKIYSTSLSTEDIMRNFIADSRNPDDMLSRYYRNSIYYNRELGEYTPYSGEGILDPEKLASVMPNVKVLMLETDHFTTSKKTFVKANLRCIHAAGGKTYPGDAYYDNWYFENGWHSGQGTTSDNYGNAGRNVDFLYNCDGVHKPSDKIKNPEADYISQVTLGYNTEKSYTEQVTDWKGDTGKVALTRTSVPNNFFNLKVNIASSENVNNALLQKRYNDFLPYISPAKRRDERIKNSMEFVPAVLFLRETNPDISTHNEFLDTEWHFYALGNLGDSKKTDYTRAYDPEDMNEFVIEISDNTKNNAVFQSGVYLDENGERQIEKFTITESVDDEGEPVYTPVSIAKPDRFVYPITQEEWESEDNMRRWCLYNEGFDGDHSFEPRYACCGDYRDGKLVNDTSGRGTEQVAVNNEVFRAFYRWVITSSDEEFVSEFDQWCVRSAVEFFYAFTHMYTMMDNRAKNTFWHFAKTGSYRLVSRPVKELLHVYCELVDGEYILTEDVEIDSSKTYYTQYAFDLWDYDNDTALGINNNGELVFPYGKEDTDYNIEGLPSSGYVFNGATSVFWCRLRDLLSNEIANTFTSVAAECFSATHLIEQFDTYQECFPEEIWRLDIERKYIRTFLGTSIDNSKPKHDVQYLRDMMQGRKKYQRRQWIRDQEMYFGTKYLMNTVVGDDNRITFRCFTPTGDDVAVEPDYTLHITPYSDMYVSVMFGNGGVQQIRAKGGQEYAVECPLSSMDDTQVTIYGANRIQALGDLSPCYIAANNFSMATKMTRLILGSTVPGYSNSRLISLTMGNNKSLIEMDIRNCSNLTGSINLSQCTNLKRLYAEGTKITGVIFATNGKVQIAHLPDTINTLTMRNLNDLVDFEATLNQLETLTLEGGTLDSLAMITDTVDTLQVLYLYNIDWTVGDTELLNQILELFYSMLTGSVYVSGQIRQQELLSYSKKWADLRVSYDPAYMVEQYLMTFVNYDGIVLYEQYVDRGSIPLDPIETGDIQIPTKESTAQYDFTYSGWDDLDSIALADRTITAQYTSTVRSYTVNWYQKPGVLLETQAVEYGQEAAYSGENPTNTSEEDTYVYNLFKQWDKSTGYVTSDMDVFAVWSRANLPAEGTDLKDMSITEIFGVCTARKAADYFVDKDYFDFTMGQDLTFSNVRSEVLLENTFFDGNTYIDTNIRLFDADSPSFTLAIDYEFLSSCATNGSLVSAFVEDGSEGFRLRYNVKPDIQWGDKNANVGYPGNRNMVVLRHAKGSNSLYVYGIDTESIIYPLVLGTSELIRTRETETNQPLTFGALRQDDTSYNNFATGWIHWCKIWYDDLGETVAQKLAAWPHEVYRMEFTGADRYYLSESTQKANASFFSNHCLPRIRRVYASNANASWNYSELRTEFFSKRVYNGFSYELQAAIKQVKIPSGNRNQEIEISNDYVYLPSFVELSSGAEADLYKNEGSTISFYTTNISRIKFNRCIIRDEAKYFTMDSDPSIDNVVNEGDIWFKTDNEYTAYMYFSSETISKHSTIGCIPTSHSANIAASDGGVWLRDTIYSTRTISMSNANKYITVHYDGYTPLTGENISNCSHLFGFSI